MDKSAFVLVLLMMLLSREVKSDISDDECALHDLESIASEIASDNALPEAEAPKVDYQGRARPDQKSLLIIFDATGSMSKDLAQVKASAQDIVVALAEHAENPIYNFVLSVFRDEGSNPIVQPIVDTKVSSELIKGIAAITVSGGGSTCPEYPMHGIKAALDHALPNSLAYVFTDAFADDYFYYDTVAKLAQEKQVKVNFLVTGACGVKTTPKFEVYEKLARITDGQIFDMKRESVKNVLNEITKSLNPKYESLKSVDFSGPGASKTGINVDKSFKELSVTVSGTSAKLTINDKNNVKVEPKSSFSTDDIKIMTFEVSDSSYNIEASANSAYSIRVGGISDLKFGFGFSTALTGKRMETAPKPLKGFPNVLSIFVSDPSLVKCMTKATLIAADAGNSFEPLVIPLKQVAKSQFSTKLFTIPEKAFKIQVTGYDSEGTLIERLISVGLEAAKPAPPTLDVTYNNQIVNEFSQLYMNCIVQSLVPVKVTWKFESEIIRQNTTKQSTSFVMSIDNFHPKYAGKYSCTAENEHGTISKSVDIGIKLAPTVEVVPSSIEVIKGVTAVIECKVTNSDLDYKIIWTDEFGFEQKTNDPKYQFTAGISHHEKHIYCRIQDNVFDISSSSFVTVVFAPEFTLYSNGTTVERFIEKSSDFTIKCESRENPKATVQWFYTDNVKDLSTFKLIDHERASLKMTNMKSSMQGLYKCVVENTIGFAFKHFDVKLKPKEQPKIKSAPKVVVIEGEKAQLECSCTECTPVLISGWKKKSKPTKGFKTFVDEEKETFVTELVIPKATKSDAGEYICEIKNKKGKKNAKIQLVVETKPQIPNGLVIRLMQGKNLYKKIVDVVVIDKLDDFRMDYAVRGFPIPEATWFKDGEKLSTKEVALPKADIAKYAGHYEIVVENVVGKVSQDFEVKVNLAPSTESKKLQRKEIDEGQPISLNCDIVGNPEPEISWTHDGDELDSSDLHKLSHQNRVLRFRGDKDLAGTYTCTGKNGQGQEQITFQVVFKGPPMIDGVKSYEDLIKKQAGSSLELTCDATGYPTPEVTWTKSNAVAKTGNVLKIARLKAKDAGNYKCTAENQYGFAFKLVKVSVVVFPYFVFDLENLTLPAGDYRMVECFARGLPEPKVHWEHNGKFFSNGDELRVINFPAGTYTCVAENSEGRAETSFELEIPRKLELLPEYDKFNRTLFVKAGESVKLLCPFKNFETVTWNQEENVLPGEVSEELEIEKAEESSQGIFECTAANDKEQLSFAYTIEVLTSPKIIDDNGLAKPFVLERDVAVQAGKALELKCETRGNPIPTVQWQRLGKVIDSNETLVIDNVQAADMGTYECIAENSQGTARKVFTVTVTTQPFIEDGETRVFKQGYADENFVLNCAIGGHPRPTIYWYKGENFIQTWGSPALILSEFSVDKTGDYKCIGRNDYGQASVDFSVSIKNRLKIVSANYVNLTSHRQFSCVVDTELRPAIVIKDLNGVTLASFDTKSKDLNLNSTFYFDKDGKQTRFTEAKTLLNSGQPQFSAVIRLSETTFKLILTTKSNINPKTFKCATEGEDMNNEKDFVAAENSDDFGDGEGSMYFVSAALNQSLSLFCEIKTTLSSSIAWFMNRKKIKPGDSEFLLMRHNTQLDIKSTMIGYENAFKCTAKSTKEKKIVRNFVIKFEWSDWSEWGPCSRTCGTGYQTQSRTCSSDKKCRGPTHRYQYCKGPACKDIFRSRSSQKGLITNMI